MRAGVVNARGSKGNCFSLSLAFTYLLLPVKPAGKFSIAKRKWLGVYRFTFCYEYFLCGRQSRYALKSITSPRNNLDMPFDGKITSYHRRGHIIMSSTTKFRELSFAQQPRKKKLSILYSISNEFIMIHLTFYFILN